MTAIRWLLLGLGAAAGLSLSAWGQQAPHRNGVTLPSGPQEGARLFERLRCATCHTVGDGEDRGGPNLGRLNLRLSFMDGAARMWNHVPMMQKRMRELHLPYPSITGNELTNVVAFFTSYQYYLTRVGQPGVPARGGVLLRTKGCLSCHSLQRGVKAEAPNLSTYGGGRSTLEIARAMWNHGPAMQRRMERKGIPRPYFRPGEMTDLLSFLASRGAPSDTNASYVEPGSPIRGRDVFSARGCSRCHPLRGVGGKPGVPDLGRQRSALVRDYTDVAALMWNHAVPMWARMRREGFRGRPLRTRELADLIAYLYFVNYAGEPGDPSRGKKLFERKRCDRCHPLVTATGGKVGPVLALAPGLNRPQDVLAAMWRAAPEMGRQLRKMEMGWPKFAPGELGDLIEFIQSRGVARGRRGTAGKGTNQ